MQSNERSPVLCIKNRCHVEVIHAQKYAEHDDAVDARPDERRPATAAAALPVAIYGIIFLLLP